jgi:hypothetical protein
MIQTLHIEAGVYKNKNDSDTTNSDRSLQK